MSAESPICVYPLTYFLSGFDDYRVSTMVTTEAVPENEFNSRNTASTQLIAATNMASSKSAKSAKSATSAPGK